MRIVKKHNSSYHYVALSLVSKNIGDIWWSNVHTSDMAASAYGRDYLAKKPEGQSLIDLYCTTLSEAPTGPAWYVYCGHMYLNRPSTLFTMTCKYIIHNCLSFAVPSSESKHLTSRTLYS